MLSRFKKPGKTEKSKSRDKNTYGNPSKWNTFIEQNA